MMVQGNPDNIHPQKPTIFSLSGGGWVLLVAMLMVCAIIAWRLVYIIPSLGTQKFGDGKEPQTYGFDLSNALIDQAYLTTVGRPKDGIPALTDPPMFTAADADAINENQRGKYLVSGDRVIGVSMGDEARAYPLRVISWHEVINDTIAGIPVAVTYSPTCDSVVVFDRRVDGETLEFGVSGLVYNSNLLMFDRRGDVGESLWSQLHMRAVAGPAATRGDRLTQIPAQVVRWDHWREAHPGTLVVEPQSKFGKRYKKEPFQSYFGSSGLKFPVSPLPSSEELPLKSRVLAVKTDTEMIVFSLPYLAEKVNESGDWLTAIGGREVRMSFRSNPATAMVQATDGKPLNTIHALHFALHAFYPNAPRVPTGAED